MIDSGFTEHMINEDYEKFMTKVKFLETPIRNYMTFNYKTETTSLQRKKVALE